MMSGRMTERKVPLAKVFCIVGLVLATLACARGDDVENVASLLELVIDASPEAARECLTTLSDKSRNRELSAEQISALQKRLGPTLRKVLAAGAENALYHDVAFLAASWKDPAGVEAVRKLAAEGAIDRRLKAIETLAASGDAGVVGAVEAILADRKKHPADFRGSVIIALGRLEDAKVAALLIANWPSLEPELQPKAIEVLTQRVHWSRALLEEIGRGKIPAAALNLSQVVKLQGTTDK